MPESKLVARGSVSNIIDKLHKLEYESGRIDEPVKPKQYNTLTTDHPAQRAKSDRPVQFHKRPLLHKINPKDKQPQTIDHAASRFKIPEEQPTQKQHFFRRRDCTGESICVTPARPRRESLSHRAFDGVRRASASPPLVASIPRVEILPWPETAEQYIARKLTERWSSPSRSASASHSQVKVGRSRSSCGVASPHLEAPLVQELLNNIDKILSEHTGTLRDVIDSSKRALHEREMQCLESRQGREHEYLIANGHRQEDEWSQASSTLPDLIAAVDETAQHMGLRLPHFDQRHPSTIHKGQRGRGRALSLVSPRSQASPQPCEFEASARHHEEETQPRRRDSSSPMMHGALRAESSRSYRVPSISYREPLRSLGSFQPLPCQSLQSVSSKPSQHYQITSEPAHDQAGLSAKLYYQDSSRSFHEGQIRHLQPQEASPRDLDSNHEATIHTPEHSTHHHHHPFSPPHHSRSPADHVTEDAADCARSVASGFGSIERRTLTSPSPPFIEYDRFAALADRASRNSIVDLVNSTVTRASLTSIEGLQRKLSDAGRISGSEGLVEANIPKVKDPGPEEDAARPKRNKISGSWLEKSNAPEERGKMKRATTMDRLMEKEGYESQVKKRIKQDVPVDEPIKKISKRETMKMMDGIMSRQGRDKERAAGWKK